MDCDKLIQSVIARLTDITSATFLGFFLCSGAELIDFLTRYVCMMYFITPLKQVLRVILLSLAWSAGLMWGSVQLQVFLIELALNLTHLQSAEIPVRSSRDGDPFPSVLKLFCCFRRIFEEPVIPGKDLPSCRLLLGDDKAHWPQILTSQPRWGERGPFLLWHQEGCTLDLQPLVSR